MLLLAALAVGTVAASDGGAKFSLQSMTARRWTKEDGLPDDDVTAVLQTRDGYLWVGTAGGLARFDGVRFTVITLPAANSNQVLRVTALCEDQSGRLWIGTQQGGLLWYAADVLQRFASGSGGLNRAVTSIAADVGGDLWIGTPEGLDRIRGAVVTRFGVADGLPGEFVSSVHAARSGSVYITTRAGMCVYRNGQVVPLSFQTESAGRSPEPLGAYEDRQGNMWAFGDTYLANLGEGKRFNYFGGGGTSSSRIWNLCEGRDGQLWIGTSGQGLLCFVGGSFLPLGLRDSDPAPDVRALCEDRDGNLWLGTHGSGLVRLQPHSSQWLTVGNGASELRPSCLAFNTDGRLWAGFVQGGVYSGVAGQLEREVGDGSFGAQNLVCSLGVAPDGSIWVGTLGAGLYRLKGRSAIRFTTAHGLSDDTVLAVAVEANGTVWAGTAAGGLHRFSGEEQYNFDTSAGLTGSGITAILPGGDGVLWVGTEAGEILRGRGGKFSRAGTTAPLGKSIHALYEDFARRLWFGTAGAGLGCLAQGRLLNWDTKAGFPDDWVTGVVGDDDGHLWVATSRGVFRIDRTDAQKLFPSAPRARLVFEAEAAATGTQPGWPRAARSPDGRVWLALGNGLVAFDPRRLETPVSLPVRIEAVLVNNRLAPADAEIRLPADLRSLEIQYTALNLSAPEKVRFQYKLDGFDTGWMDAGAQRSARYPRLGYGEYAFRLRAESGDGAWHETAAPLRLVFPPPFWRSPVALALYAVGSAAAVAGAARVVSYRRLRRKLARLAQQQAMQKERMRIAQDMHDEIGSKLTKISYLSERAKGDLQDRPPTLLKLDAIAQTSRDLLQSLDEIVWAVNPQNDTLEHLAAYLGHYATEYLQNTTTECELHIPRGLPHCSLSAEVRHNLFLAFEEALNNALKHGRAAKVRVAMAVGAGRFEITVADDGCGFDLNGSPTRRTGGNGLPNMRQRMADVGGRCDIQSQAGQGTTVSLNLPLNRREEDFS